MLHLLVEHVHLDPRPTLWVPDEQPETLLPERFRRGHEAAVAGPERDLEQEPASVRRTLGEQLELLGPHPGCVARRDLATGQHVKRETRCRERLAEPVDPAPELGEPHLTRVRRAHDPASPVGDGKPGEIKGLAVIARSVVDAWEKMKMKLGAHPMFTTRAVRQSFGRMWPDNGMTTRT